MSTPPRAIIVHTSGRVEPGCARARLDEALAEERAANLREQPAPTAWPGLIQPPILSSTCAGRLADGTLWWVAPGCGCEQGVPHPGRPCRGMRATPAAPWVALEVFGRVLALRVGDPALNSPMKAAKAVRMCGVWAEVPLSISAERGCELAVPDPVGAPGGPCDRAAPAPRQVSFFATTEVAGREEAVLTPAVAWGVWAVHAVAHESRVHVTGWREAVPGPRLYVADGRVVCAPPGGGVALDEIAVEHMPPSEWAVSHMPLGLRAATGPLAADACALAARLADGWPNWCSDARRVTASEVANLRALLAEVQPGALAGIEGLGATIRAAQGMTPGTSGAPGRLRARLL